MGVIFAAIVILPNADIVTGLAKEFHYFCNYIDQNDDDKRQCEIKKLIQKKLFNWRGFNAGIVLGCLLPLHLADQGRKAQIEHYKEKIDQTHDGSHHGVFEFGEDKKEKKHRTVN